MIGKWSPLRVLNRGFAVLAAVGILAGGVLADTPKKVKDAKATERSLFLTPGGVYTKADIKANGNKTVTEKYPHFMAAHDAKPKKGDRICPITDTKANPKLTWVVSGKTYQFCCPPCVTEFVTKAKTAPGSIKGPEAYVKK